MSAILELSHLVQRLFELNNPKDGISVNVGTIDGGLTTNVVAPDGRITVEVRVITEQQGREIERAIRKLKPVTSGARLEVIGGGQQATASQDRSQQGVVGGGPRCWQGA